MAEAAPRPPRTAGRAAAAAAAADRAPSWRSVPASRRTRPTPPPRWARATGRIATPRGARRRWRAERSRSAAGQRLPRAASARQARPAARGRAGGWERRTRSQLDRAPAHRGRRHRRKGEHRHEERGPVDAPARGDGLALQALAQPHRLQPRHASAHRVDLLRRVHHREAGGDQARKKPEPQQAQRPGAHVAGVAPGLARREVRNAADKVGGRARWRGGRDAAEPVRARLRPALRQRGVVVLAHVVERALGLAADPQQALAKLYVRERQVRLVQ